MKALLEMLRTDSKSLEMIEERMKRGYEGLDELLGAVYREDVSKLRELLADGISIDAADSDGRTALMHATLATPVSTRVVEFLLREGANPNAQDAGQRWTALHFAARDGNAEIVRRLLQSGASVDALDVFGNTPMWRAIFAAPRNQGCLDCIRLLIGSGADPGLENKSGVSPLVLARDPGQEAALGLIEGRLANNGGKEDR